MMELGQLEAHHAEFEKRKTRVAVVSIEDQEAAQATQTDFPHLLAVADANRQLTEGVAAIHADSNPTGGDTAAPTTILVDGAGNIRWTFRPDTVFRRLSPAEVLAAVDEHLKR